MKLQVITPKALVLETEAREVVVPGALGSMGFLPGHQALVSALCVGELHYKDAAGRELGLLVHGGFVEVNHDVVTVLADAVELPEDIDLSTVGSAEQRASALRNEQKFVEAQAELELSQLRKKVATRRG